MGSLWNSILNGLGTILAFCYGMVNSYGAAIGLFTLIIMIVFTPLTLKSTRSMMAMQMIQPEMKALQAKYRDDRQTLNTEMMALYQRHGVNPLGGCLPMVVQIPIFFALFSLLRGLTRLNDAGTEFSPRHVDEDTQLFKDLSTAGGEMLSLGIDLSRQANDVVSDSLVTSIPYVLMVVVTGLTSWFQQRQMASRRTPGQEVPQQQQMLMKILPWTLPVFAFFMPAALVVYFIVSNMWRVAQQSYISRRIHIPSPDLVSDKAIEAEVVEDGPPKKRVGKAKKQAQLDKAPDESPDPAPASDRPRPKPRQRPSRPAAAPSSKKPSSGKSSGRSKAKPSGPTKPSPTGRTAGHGPSKRPTNKKKRR